MEDPGLELFETIIIFKSIPEKEIEKKIEKVLNILRSKPAWKKIKVNKIGDRKLAYDINGINQGYYVKFQYLGDIDLTRKLTVYMKQDDDVLKYITVKSDEDPNEVLEDMLRPGNSIDAYEVLFGLKDYNQKGGEQLSTCEK